ncbi:MAG: ABC transporter permease subunit [Chloroflexi bacterium]|nr:ABC transporter permease subunit [Chloroflexota bacterium]
MRNVWTIASRELRAFVVSPVPYVVSALFLIIMGYLFALILITSQEASMRPAFSNMMFVLLLLAPALTMRLLAEEHRMGTIELLLTSPVRDWQVVVGKFLGSLITFALLILGPTLYYPLLMKFLGNPDTMPIVTGYIGMLLFGSTFLAIGILTSSLTQNQVIAYFAGFVLLLLLFIAEPATSISGQGPLGTVLSYIGIQKHYDAFFSGVIDTIDVVYGLSVIAVSLILATLVMQARRWR